MCENNFDIEISNEQSEATTSNTEEVSSEYKESEEKWCIVRIPGLRYKVLAPIIESMFETRKRHKFIDQMGYIFVKHNPDTLAPLLFPLNGAYPLRDCATKKPATISEEDLNLFTSLIEDTGVDIIFLDHDLSYYADGHVKVVCIDPPLLGKTGYIVRRNGNRNFIFSLSNAITISATNAHKLRFVSEEDFKKAQENGII